MTEAGPVTVRITALDGTGSIEHTATFVVAAESGVKVTRSIRSILNGLGPTDGKGGLVFLPGMDFSFMFPKDTFLQQEKVAHYEAVSADNTPLPSWINFDDGTLKFSGKTPDAALLIASSQSFEIRLVASHVPGFQGASLFFQMVVGTNQLLFEDSYVQENITIGVPFSHTTLWKSIQLDGQPISLDNLASVTANTTDWLSFDERSLTISGTPLRGMESLRVYVIARDIFGGEAVQVVDLHVRLALFTLKLPDFDIYHGQQFKYVINKTCFSAEDVKVSADLEPPIGWLYFSSDDLSFKGQAPKDTPDCIRVTLTVSTLSEQQSERQSFDITIHNKKTVNSSKSSTPTSSSVKKSSVAVDSGLPAPSKFT